MSDSFENQIERERYYEAEERGYSCAGDHTDALVESILKDRCSCPAHRAATFDDFISHTLAFDTWPRQQPSTIHIVPPGFVHTIRQDEADALEAGWRNMKIELGAADSIPFEGKMARALEILSIDQPYFAGSPASRSTIIVSPNCSETRLEAMREAGKGIGLRVERADTFTNLTE